MGLPSVAGRNAPAGNAPANAATQPAGAVKRTAQQAFKGECIFRLFH
jgi:hypothetical protein